MNLPRFRSYGNYSSGNYGVHTLRFDIGSLALWYSYHTVIAFDHPKTGFKIRENIWGTTTGKHLNWVEPDHSIRIGGAEFEELLQSVIGVL